MFMEGGEGEALLPAPADSSLVSPSSVLRSKVTAFLWWNSNPCMSAGKEMLGAQASTPCGSVWLEKLWSEVQGAPAISQGGAWLRSL